MVNKIFLKNAGVCRLLVKKGFGKWPSEPQEGDDVIILELTLGGKKCVLYVKWFDMVVTSLLL